MKRCPDCAELIQNEARLCRYCRHEFSTALGPGQSRSPHEDRNRLIGFGLILALLTVGIVGNAVRSSGEPPPDNRPKAPAPDPPAAKGPNELTVRMMAERNLKQLLKDPDSAELRNVRVPSGAAYACGEVNSRNAFGGYTGFRRFMAGASASMPVGIEEENMEPAEFGTAWQKLC